MGNVSTTIGIVYEVGSIVENKKIMPSDVINLIWGGVSFTGIGAVASAGYYTFDWMFMNIN